MYQSDDFYWIAFDWLPLATCELFAKKKWDGTFLSASASNPNAFSTAWVWPRKRSQISLLISLGTRWYFHWNWQGQLGLYLIDAFLGKGLSSHKKRLPIRFAVISIATTKSNHDSVHSEAMMIEHHCHVMDEMVVSVMRVLVTNGEPSTMDSHQTYLQVADEWLIWYRICFQSINSSVTLNDV